MSDSITELINTLSAAWDSVVPAEGLPNLHSLPHQLHDALFAPGGVFDKLTNGGTVPLPVPASWLESVSSPPVAPPPPPPPPSSALFPRWFQHALAHVLKHPYVYSLATVSATTGATYYYSPRTLDPLVSFVPASVLPRPKHRPSRLLPSTHGVAAEIRKEAVIVLGADSVEGREIALDLERRGWVVIATVSDPDQVDKLEKEGRGWIKVLVLDPSESSSVSPFLRSLSTALSLRFPLHTSGDPFSRPSHALALTSLVDCLAIPLGQSRFPLVPLEAVENDQIKKDLTERISTFVLVSKGVLPFLRSSSSRPGAPTSTYLLLLPSLPSNVSLPFLSLSSTLSQSLESLFHSLRRELSLSTPRPNLKLSIVQLGSFHVPDTSDPTRTTTTTTDEQPSPRLPIRLSSLYAPALSRRRQSLTSSSSSSTSSSSSSSSSSLGTVVARGGRRRQTPLSHLCSKISLILLRPNHSPTISLVGTRSWIHYYFGRWSPIFGSHAMIDAVLNAREWLVERVYERVQSTFKRRSKLEGSRQERLGGGGGGGGGGIPESLKPRGHGSKGPSQVPLRGNDSFLSHQEQPQPPRREGTSSTTTTTTKGFSSNEREEEGDQDEGDEDDGTSSIEDLGISTGSLSDLHYGTGSYINV